MKSGFKRSWSGTPNLSNHLRRILDETPVHRTTTQYSFLPGQNFSNSYGYDAASNRTSFTAPNASTDSYQYDTLNRLSTLTDSQTGQFGFGYDALSRRTSLTRPNGINTSYSYDSLSHLLTVLHQAGSTTVDGAAYTYDPAGNRNSKTNYLDGTASNYTYDALYQLLQVTQGNVTSESYTYDAVGNRLTSLGVAAYNYNASNQLTSTSNATYTYDYNGNTLTKMDTTGATQYAWDFENRLTSVTLPDTGNGPTVVTFKYDPFGRRIQKSSPSGVTNYLYDGANSTEEVDQSGTLLAKYTQGSDLDDELAQLRSATLGYYERDGLGSITSFSNSAATLANTYTYNAFGKLSTSSETLISPFEFTGREYDAETDVQFYRARYYLPDLGRFLSEDPAGFEAGTNFYAYVNNNPIVLIDPLGLAAKGGWATLPPDPKANTLVCNGHGGQKVQLGSPGTPEQAACLGDCMRVHEETHIRDSMAAAPKICVGKPAGTLVGSWGQTHDNTEVAASNAEIDCLKKKLKKEPCDGPCTNTINDRIKQMEDYRDKRGPYRSR